MSPPIKVGSKVICVDTTGFKRLYNESVPVMNGIYTVRQIINDPDGGTVKCLRLHEIVNQPAPYASGIAECSFKSTRFAVKRGK